MHTAAAGSCNVPFFAVRAGERMNAWVVSCKALWESGLRSNYDFTPSGPYGFAQRQERHKMFRDNQIAYMPYPSCAQIRVAGRPQEVRTRHGTFSQAGAGRTSAFHDGRAPVGTHAGRRVMVPAVVRKAIRTGRERGKDEGMTRLVVIGLGPLGQRMVRYALERKSVELVGGVEIDPEKQGKELGRLCGTKRLGLKVAPDLKRALGRRKADVAILTTVSSVRTLEPQVREVAARKLNIVSTCEELAFPWRTQRTVATRIDALCRKAGVTCLGTGVNPGFLMDFLPAILTGANQKVTKITVKRFQDASSRRVPFQQKIGAGLTRAEFRARKRTGTLRHVGLPESIDLIAYGMGWKLTEVTETLRAVVAHRRITSGHKPIEEGMTCGVEQIGKGFIGKREAIRLHFRAAVGEPESFDSVEIRGEPNVWSVIEGGINGDIATCAVVLNALDPVRRAEPGLRSMLDIPPVTWSE